jgi:hypothetical protein
MIATMLLSLLTTGRSPTEVCEQFVTSVAALRAGGTPTAAAIGSSPVDPCERLLANLADL